MKINLTKKIKGHAEIFIVSIFALSLMCFLFYFMISKKVADLTYEKVDMAVTQSLLSAANPNIEASYSSKGSGILFISPRDGEFEDATVLTTENYTELNEISNRFIEGLKFDLDLNENMESENHMIEGPIKIEYLRLYEFRRLNDNLEVIQYLYSNGIWKVESIKGSLDSDEDFPDIFIKSSWNFEEKQVTNSALEVSLILNVKTQLGENDVISSDYKKEITVNYKRFVEINEEN